MYPTAQSDFNLGRHVIALVNKSPFFAELSRQLTKVPTRSLPTAGVCFDAKRDQVTLYYNPDFMASLTDSEIRGVLLHEFYHIIFGHLAARRKAPHRLWNIATDLAINSIIISDAAARREGGNDGKDSRPLPRAALVPGRWPVMPDGRELSREEKEGSKLAALIAEMPEMKASEWYFEHLLHAAKDEAGGDGDGQEGGPSAGGPGEPGDGNGDGTGDGWLDSFDKHEAWDDLPEEQREYLAAKVRSMVERAVREADSRSNGWGDVPAELHDEIRRSISTVINWRSVLRQFVGNLVRSGRSTTLKRINRRYPYMYPGTKRSHVARLLVARDESGSVSNEMLALFFAELSSLTKKVDIDFLPFDCSCDPEDIVRWTKGRTPEKATKRTRGGGTDFNAPTRLFNDPAHRGRWDGMLILTDGQAPAPEPCRSRRGWVLAEGCKLEFGSNELQVFVTPDRPMVGAWR